MLRPIKGAKCAYCRACLHSGTKTEALLLQQGNDLEVFYVEVNDRKIHDSVRKILRSTGHVEDSSTKCSCMRTAKIRSVHRIENYRLWHRYMARLAAMRQDHASSNIAVASAALDVDGHDKIMTRLQSIFDCGEALAHDVDEKILLHGTSWDNADSIVQNGFDNRTCQRGMYGAGVYFASAGCKSHQYTCTQHLLLRLRLWENFNHCACSTWGCCSRHWDAIWWEKAASQKQFIWHPWFDCCISWADQRTSPPESGASRVCDFWPRASVSLLRCSIRALKKNFRTILSPKDVFAKLPKVWGVCCSFFGGLGGLRVATVKTYNFPPQCQPFRRRNWSCNRRMRSDDV